MTILFLRRHQEERKRERDRSADEFSPDYQRMKATKPVAGLPVVVLPLQNAAIVRAEEFCGSRACNLSTND